ncbi:MAG: helix-hairpin-helix domain-containing protein [Alkalibacterium sp.]|nr:helix-hairpin-helix domain-containing protein [Alkalibacterium sp.]
MKKIEKNKLTILFVLAILILSMFFYRMIGLEDSRERESEEVTLESVIVKNEEELEAPVGTASPEEENPTQSIHVDIKGAVNSPGVYEMRPTHRINDVIQKAGGLKDDSDSKTINFAKQLEDEMMIYVPYAGEEVVIEQSASPEALSDGTININQADLNDLLSLNGIGPQKAQEIIAYRESQGPFGTIQDITNVSGIGEKTLEKIQDHITVN